MTESDLARIEAYCEAASTGPWRVKPDEEVVGKHWIICWSTGCDPDGKQKWVTTDHVHASELNGSDAAKDAEFIAAARTDLPAACREIRKLREEVERLRSEDEAMAAELWMVTHPNAVPFQSWGKDRLPGTSGRFLAMARHVRRLIRKAEAEAAIGELMGVQMHFPEASGHCAARIKKLRDVLEAKP